MRDIMRSYIHTVINCDIADLNTGKIKNIDYTLNTHYTSEKHMITKLTAQLESENKRLITLKNYHEVKTSYYMKESTFIKYHDYSTMEGDIIEKPKTKAKKKGNKKHE